MSFYELPTGTYGSTYGYRNGMGEAASETPELRQLPWEIGVEKGQSKAEVREERWQKASSGAPEERTRGADCARTRTRQNKQECGQAGQLSERRGRGVVQRNEICIRGENHGGEEGGYYGEKGKRGKGERRKPGIEGKG